MKLFQYVRQARADQFLFPVVVLTWIGLSIRILPDRDADRGIFVSTAEWLLAGDRLYSGVFDNKEPLFYYFIAAQRALGWGAEIAAEAMLLLLAAAAVYLLALKVTSRWTAIAVSLLAAPIVLIGGYYTPGYSELPGVVLALIGIALAFYDRPFLAGCCIGTLIFAKLIYVPVAIAGVGCVVIIHRRPQDLLLVAAATAASALSVVGILFMRGEFWPFIEGIKLNIAYSQGPFVGGTTRLETWGAHLKLAGGSGLSGQIILIILVNVVALFQLFFSDRAREGVAMALVSLAILPVSLGILAITGLWEHHVQILYIPTLISIVAVAPLFELAARKAPVLTLLTVILCACILGGPVTMNRYLSSIKNFRSTLAQMSTLPPEARQVLAVGDSGTYARLGQNDDLGHAIGLRNWHLACPRFHQYPFLPKELLDEVRDCASKTPVLILSAALKTRDTGPAEWNEFVTDIESLVKSYHCDDVSGVRVCRR